MNDRQVQDLIRGQFMNQMIFRIMDNAKASRNQGKEIKMPLFVDIICSIFVLLMGSIFIGTILLCLLGLLLAIFD